jgi:hypothetical protein
MTFNVAELLDHVTQHRREESSPATEEITPFNTFDAGNWEGKELEPRKWCVLNRIPAGEPGILSGDGGTGKTALGPCWV